MNKKVFRLILTFTAAISIFTGCRSVPGEKEKINLNGMIYDTDNKPVVNYRCLPLSLPSKSDTGALCTK